MIWQTIRRQRGWKLLWLNWGKQFMNSTSSIMDIGGWCGWNHFRCCINVKMGQKGVQNHGKCLFYQLHLWYVSLVAWLSVPGEGWSRPSDRINRGLRGIGGNGGGGGGGVLDERMLTSESSHHEKNIIRKTWMSSISNMIRKLDGAKIFEEGGWKSEIGTQEKKGRPRDERREGEGGGRQDQEARWVLRDLEV